MKRLLFILLLIVVALPSCVFEQEDENLFEIVGEKNALVFGENGGSNSVILKSGSKWQITKKPEWISIDSVAPGNNPFEWIVRFKCEENGGDFRRGTVVFSTAYTEIDFDIVQNAVKTISVKTVEVDPTELELELNNSAEINVTVTPENATNKEVSLSSSSPEVATVDEFGIVKALKVGKTTITATSISNQEVSAQCVVTVTAKHIPVQSISVSPDILDMKVGDEERVKIIVTPNDATKKDVSCSNPSIVGIAEVIDNSDGTFSIRALMKGTTSFTFISDDNPKATASLTVNVTLENEKPVPVDLGLSVKWASCNVGASSPEEYGDFFAWGETAPKSDYQWSTYKFELGTDENGPFSEYVTNPSYGTVDNKTVLAPKDDAAHVNLGDVWRMPSRDEFQELKDNCTWTWTTQNGVNGYKITSNKPGYNDRSIFLPVAGYMFHGRYFSGFEYGGNYWSLSLNTDLPGNAYFVNFGPEDFSLLSRYRCRGQSVRAVYGVVPVTDITLNSTSCELLKEGTSNLTATTLPVNATYKDLTWTSSDESVATVDASGKVTAVALGIAEIKAHSADDKALASCEVTVIRKAESIALDKTKLEIYVGDQPTALVATVSPAKHTTKRLYWSSLRPSVATVDENGNVKAVSAGTTTIQVKALDGSGLSDECVVTVYNRVKAITLNEKSITIYKDKTHKLTATVTPNNSNKAVIWTSDDTNIATVDESGTVKGIGIGTAVITAITKDGSLSASCEVAVYQYVTSIELSRTDIEMFVGDEPITLNATVFPSKYVNNSISWSSSNSDVAKVESCGVITAVSNGQAIIYARADDGSGVRGKCTISVRTRVAAIKLDESEATINVGESLSLIATITPSSASDKSIIWSSADAAIATVNNSGTVTGVGLGTTTVSATTVDGGYTASCAILVQPIPESAVNLGLSVLWATCNVGATKPDGYGYYLAWGETEPKEDYSWPTYTLCKDKYNTQTKYNTNPSYGTLDNKIVLGPEDDAAYVKWGGRWRMPTDAEWTELREKCEWTWTDNYNGTRVAGIIVTSKIDGYTDKSIFLPAAGGRGGTNLSGSRYSGYYWSSSLNTDNPSSTWCVTFSSGYVNRRDESRYYGYSIRPVYGKTVRSVSE